MTAENHIRNPVEWGLDQLRAAGHAVDEAGHAVAGTDETRYTAPPSVRRISVSDLKEAVARGVDDLGAFRTDVVAVALIYPLVGLLLANLVFGYDFLPLLFPLASGFALLGPVAAVGLYEMSRRREAGMEASWLDALAVLRSPRFGAIFTLGLLLAGIFLAWMVAAQTIYALTVGPDQPASLAAFRDNVFTTPEGWTMIAAGMGVGFLFAVAVLMISVISFPLLLDRDVGLPTAIGTSIRACVANPGPMALWGLFVAVSLVAGSVPLLLGLAVVVPVLGHATWHLYRRVCPR